jgi:polysaccharide export outer membrane protein
MKSYTPNTSGALMRIVSTVLRPVWGRTGKSLVVFPLALFAGLALTACGPSSADYQIPPAAFNSTPGSSLAIGDILRFSYVGAPEFNQLQKIRPDGQVSLPTVGNVRAAGRSVNSLQASLTSLYGPHLNDPTVFIAVEKPAALVYVSGEVNAPGKYELDRPLSALSAVMEAGGFSKLANPKQVFVIRNQSGKEKRYTLNLNNTLSGVETQPFYLRANDVVYVKRSNW